MEKKYLKEASLGMAVTDALPVLCFCGTIAFLSMIWKSPLFLLGGVLCIGAGAGKVLWKLILAVRKRNVEILYRQFRYLMSGGFLLMLVSLAAGYKKIRPDLIWKNLSWFPGNLCFLIGILGMILMIVLAVKMDPSSKKANWIEQGVNFVAQAAILLGVLLIWYGNDSYPAAAEAVQALEDTDVVAVKEIGDGILFDGAGEDAALIFYPGAKVEYTAYAPVMKMLAEEGIDCFLLEMPYHMAIFGMDRAGDIMEQYTYDSWYLGGHSLGGAMAASYASGHPEQLNGLVLLAAYPTKPLPEEGMRVLSLYGSEDGVLNMEKLAQGEQYMPEDAVTFCIEGGNHAGFGSYGDQKGDGKARITGEEQWKETVVQIRNMMGK